MTKRSRGRSGPQRAGQKIQAVEEAMISSHESVDDQLLSYFNLSCSSVLL